VYDDICVLCMHLYYWLVCKHYEIMFDLMIFLWHVWCGRVAFKLAQLDQIESHFLHYPHARSPRFISFSLLCITVWNCYTVGCKHTINF
jgi:hypothetical protein